MTIVEGVYKYLGNCPLLEGGKLKVDYLPDEVRTYSIGVVPCRETVKRYFDGSVLKQFDFVLASRNFKTESIAQNTENLAFYEGFTQWVEMQSRRHILPVLGAGRKARKLEVTTSGYPFLTDDAGTAQYQIQMKLTYYEKGSRI